MNHEVTWPGRPLPPQSTALPLESPFPRQSPLPERIPPLNHLDTVIVSNGSMLASSTLFPTSVDIELQATFDKTGLLLVRGGHDRVMDLGSSVCIPVSSPCTLLCANSTLVMEGCAGSGRSTIAKDFDRLVVFDGTEIRVYAGSHEGLIVIHSPVMVHVAQSQVLVSQSAAFSQSVCSAVQLMRRGVAFGFFLDDHEDLTLWSNGVMLMQMANVTCVKNTSVREMKSSVPDLLYSFNGTHLTKCSKQDCLTTASGHLYVTKASALYSTDPALNRELEVWLSSLHPQFEIKSFDSDLSVLYVGGERVIDLSEVHVISTLGTERLKYNNGNLTTEIAGTQTAILNVPSLPQLLVLSYGNPLPMVLESSAPRAIRGGGQVYVGSKGAFYCTNKEINTAIGSHLASKAVAMVTSLSLFSITISDSETRGAVASLSFNGTHLLDLTGDSVMSVLLPGNTIVYLDTTLSVQAQGSLVRRHEGVVSFLLFDGLQLLNYSGLGPSIIVPGGFLYIEGGTVFYTESSLLANQIASVLKLQKLTSPRACQCQPASETTPTPTASTRASPQATSLYAEEQGRNPVDVNGEAGTNIVDGVHIVCRSAACGCYCGLHQPSLVQEHEGLKDIGTPMVDISGGVDVTRQVTKRTPRSISGDGVPVTWITPVNGVVAFELAAPSRQGNLILYNSGAEVLRLTLARHVSVPSDCSVMFDGSTLQVTSSIGRTLHWYGNVASLVVFKDAPPTPRGSPASSFPGGGQLFVDADRAFYSFSDALSNRLILQASLPSFSFTPLVSFEYKINSSWLLVSVLAEGKEILVLDNLSVTEVEERPTLVLTGDSLILIESNSTSSFPNVALLMVTDGINLWNYTEIQLSLEPGLLVVWNDRAFYSSCAGLNEHVLQLILNAKISQPCISTIATVEKGVVSVLLHGNLVTQIKPEDGDTCLPVATKQSFSFVNGNIVDNTSRSFAFQGVRFIKIFANCSLRAVYQSGTTFTGPGELCVIAASRGSFFFALPSSLSALHEAYLHVVSRFHAPALAVPSFPTTFVTTSGSIVAIGQNVGIFEGLHLTFLCVVTRGNPQPNVRWTLNGNPLGEDAGGKHAIDGHHNTMTIFGVDQNDSGEYGCVASNIKGVAQAQTVLTVVTADVSCVYANDYSTCSATCGVGMQQKSVLCQRVFNGTVFPVAPHTLPISQRPAPLIRMCMSNELCSNQSYAFYIGEYGPCSSSCQGGRQSRMVTCMELQNGAFVREVEPFVCTLAGLEVPPTHRLCNMAACPIWHSGAYGNCSVHCGSGVRTRTVVCLAGSEDVVLNDDACSSVSKPAINEVCHIMDCEYQWSALEWSKCAADCIQNRAIVCIETSTGTVVDKSYCQYLNAPPLNQPCRSGDCARV